MKKYMNLIISLMALISFVVFCCYVLFAPVTLENTYHLIGFGVFSIILTQLRENNPKNL
jgi:uncharacterized membrane protein